MLEKIKEQTEELQEFWDNYAEEKPGRALIACTAIVVTGWGVSWLVARGLALGFKKLVEEKED